MLKQILITHAHVDHILASEVVSKATNAPVYYHPDDRKLWLMLPMQCMILGVPKPEKTMKPPTNLLAVSYK